MKTTIGIVSLGCPRNIVDSEAILGGLRGKGYRIVDIDKADVAVVNTCAFIEEAKRESIDAILDLVALKKEGTLKKIIVCGCLVQRYKDALRKELPEVDAFWGRVSLNHGDAGVSLTPWHYAYLKICEGCINACSFCSIPTIKGKFTSLDRESVLTKVRSFDKKRVSELNIIGQDISGWGVDLYGARELPLLLRAIVKEARHIGWIRLLYFYPDGIIDEVAKIMRDEPQLCRYIDLPLQHINDRLLKLMRRKTAKAEILRFIEKIRTRLPDVAIRTSLIVGFPSETEGEFKELLDFIEEVKFERLGAFMYSREEGTPAYHFKEQIPRKIKAARFNAIMSRQQEISRQVNERFLGRVIEVLIDEVEDTLYVGRSQYDAPEVDGVVYVKSPRILKPGDFVKVKIQDTLEYDLVGEAIEQ